MEINELNKALSGMDPAELALGAGLVGVVGTLMVIGMAAWFFISAIGYFKMFKKAGQRGWFAFIPLLREFAMFKMAWTVKAFVISTVLLAVAQFGAESQSALAAVAVIVCGIAWIVMQVKLVGRMAKSFGKGRGWGALLFFFPFIVTLILGFGSAEYLGSPEAQKAKAAETKEEAVAEEAAPTEGEN